MVKKIDISLAIISGILLILGFPPFDLYPLAWIALIPLLMSIWEKQVKTSFFIGSITGFVYCMGTTYWLFNSIYFYGNVSVVLAVLLVIALCLYLGFYVGIFSMLFSYLSRRSRFPALFIVPIIWVTLEFVRTYAFTGFPWVALGYSQYKFLALIQIADIAGVYGISFLVAAINGAIFDVAAYWPKTIDSMPLFGRWPMTAGLLILTFIIALSLTYGMWKLKPTEKGAKIQASVVQGNFEQEKKWDIKFQRQIIDTYKRLSMQESKNSPDLIVWPETAVPFIFGDDEPLTDELIEFQKILGVHLLFGSVIIRDIKDNKYQLSNSAILMSPDGEVLSTYDKIHLVPFGEYVPLQKFFPFIKKLVVGIGDFKPGKEYTVMNAAPVKISSPICYEIIFPGLVRKFVNKGANLIVTITNDAWFGRTSAPYQHFSMAVFRAVENRVPVVRAANTGISGFIDAKGRIKKKSDIFVKALLTDSLIIRQSRKSFYTKYGDLFAFLCIISFILLIANNINPQKEKKLLRFSRSTFGR